MEVEFCGERIAVRDGTVFTIGRDADLVVDDNPYLHRSVRPVLRTTQRSTLTAHQAPPTAHFTAFADPGLGPPTRRNGTILNGAS